MQSAGALTQASCGQRVARHHTFMMSGERTAHHCASQCASSWSHTSKQVANHCIGRTAQARKESLVHNVEEEGPVVTCAEDVQQLMNHVGVQFLACRSSAPKAPATRPRLHASGKRRAHTALLVGTCVEGMLKDQPGQATQAYTDTGRLTVTRAEAELPHKEAAMPPLAQAPAAQATSRCQHVHLTIPATTCFQVHRAAQ